MEYNFYFDESFHDRNITYNSLKSNDYFNSYVSVGIGIEKNDVDSIEKKFLSFEKIYKDKYDTFELKSSVVAKKHYRCGISSFNTLEVDMYSSFFDFLLQNKIIYYINLSDKFELLLDQCEINGFCLNVSAIVYSMTKIINVYRPKQVITDVLKSSSQFLYDFKLFCINQMKKNSNIKLKEQENRALSQMITFIDLFDVSNVNFEFDYGYCMTFEGLKKFQNEINIDRINVIIDKEGNGKICDCAKYVGYNNAEESDSKESFGVRISDLLCGFISRMMFALYNDTKHDLSLPYNEKHLLSKEWFVLSKKKFDLYKKISKYLKLESNIYYSTYVSRYFDLFGEFVGLIYYIDMFYSYEEFNCRSADFHFNEGNNFIMNIIMNHIRRMEENI